MRTQADDAVESVLFSCTGNASVSRQVHSTATACRAIADSVLHDDQSALVAKVGDATNVFKFRPAQRAVLRIDKTCE